MNSRLLEITACYTIQVIFEKQNETSKLFRQYLDVKRFTKKVDTRNRQKNSTKRKINCKGQKTKYHFQSKQ